MIAGAGVSVSGAGMLRTRRRDISIKPNRKLDRKSSRGMIYENEELRLRTIHINAEVEQGQNDIKKLRKENEQLRREIWGLRDEYDKLEEILKQQKLKENFDNSDTDYSDNEDGSNEDEETDKDNIKDEHLDNTENKNLSVDDMHRVRVDFDELSVVDEEEELMKVKDTKDGSKNQISHQNTKHLLNPNIFQDALSFYSICNPSPNSSYSNYRSDLSIDKAPEGSILLPPCPPMYANDINPKGNLDIVRPTSTMESQLGSTGFPSVSDLDKSSSETSVTTRSTKVASSPNLLKLNPFSTNAVSSIPIGIQDNSEQLNSESFKKLKHFFAPLTPKLNTKRHSESHKLTSTSEANFEKGSADICSNDNFPDNHRIAFLSSENLSINNEIDKKHSGSNLIKSLSCHDILKSERSSIERNSKHTKSDNALDSSRSFRTQMDITLKQSSNPPTPTTPEVPKLPLFDSKLFTNQYHQHFEQYRNYMTQALKKPLSVELPESREPTFCPGFYGFIPIPPGNGVKENCNMANLEQYQAMLLNGKLKSAKDIQVTSFETPSPQTFQIPPLTPYDLHVLYRKLPSLTQDVNSTDVLQSLPFLTKDGNVMCPNGPGLKVQCEACLKKVSTQTQTSVIEEESDYNRRKSRKSKLSTEYGTGNSNQKRKERIKKQISISSDTPGTPLGSVKKAIIDEKNESRSSSSGGESPIKDRKRMSIYFNPKKRSSISSNRTSKSLSLDINKGKNCTGSDTIDSAGTSSDKEKLNIDVIGKGNKNERKNSTSSENVPWCACWGNGCI